MYATYKNGTVLYIHKHIKAGLVIYHMFVNTNIHFEVRRVERLRGMVGGG